MNATSRRVVSLLSLWIIQKIKSLIHVKWSKAVPKQLMSATIWYAFLLVKAFICHLRNFFLFVTNNRYKFLSNQKFLNNPIIDICHRDGTKFFSTCLYVPIHSSSVEYFVFSSCWKLLQSLYIAYYIHLYYLWLCTYTR